MKQLFIASSMFVLLFCGCTHFGGNPKPVIKVTNVPEEGIVIDKWQVLGPFLEDDIPENTIDINSLGSFGLNEDEMMFDEFMDISVDDFPSRSKVDSTFMSRFVFTEANPVESKHLLIEKSQEVNVNYYFGCLIKCSEDIATRIHFSSNKRAKLWLNNKLILRADYSLPMASYREFWPVRLKKGNNFLMVKINKPSNNLEMYARFENATPRALERFYNLHNRGILDGSIYPWGATLKLSSRFPHSSGRIQVFGCNDSLIYNDSIYAGVSWTKNLPDTKGIYKVRAYVDGISLVQEVYRGDPADSIKKLLNAIRKLKASDRIKRNVDALDTRFWHLQENTGWYDSKYVSLLLQLKDIHDKLQLGLDPFNQASGCFVRSYVSEIDSSTQYYILHVPSSYRKGKAMPVATIVPVAISGKLPYLKNMRVANKALIDFLQDMAEKYNMIILEVGARRVDKANFNTIEEEELFYILDDVERDYSINRDRLYLAGNCSGAAELLKLVTKYPDVFAAVGLIAPDIVPLSVEDLNPWVKSNNAIHYLKNVRTLPMIDIHSAIDRHVPFATSETLKYIADSCQFENFKLVKIPNEFPKFGGDDFLDDIFKFTCEFKLNRSPNRIDFSTNQMLYNKSFWFKISDMTVPSEACVHAVIQQNELVIERQNILAYELDLTALPYDKRQPLRIVDNGELVHNAMAIEPVLRLGSTNGSGTLKKDHKVAGPLAHVFGQRFILVKGTSGSVAETGMIGAMADSIDSYWYKRYFTHCQIKKDSEVSDNDIATSHLVLLGSPKSNRVFERLANRIPLTVAPTAVKIRDTEVAGESLCYYMVYPNPLNPSRYVAVIGYNNPQFIALGAEESGFFYDVSNYGWYDFKVWDGSTGREREKGYFNSVWE